MVVEDTRAQITSAALELFVKQGYEPTSLREIADRVGITKASLYYHYPSKQALLQALVEPLVEVYKELAHEAVTRPQTPDARVDVLTRYLDLLIEHRDVAAMLKHDTAAVLTALAPLLGGMMEQVRQLQVWLAGPAPSGIALVRAQVCVEALGAVLSGGTYEQVTDRELRDTILEAALKVLGDS